MNPMEKIERILYGKCGINSYRENNIEENKLLLFANHMRESRESDPFTLTTAFSFLCAQKQGAEAVKLMLETTPVDVNRSFVSYTNNNEQCSYSDDHAIPPLHIAIEHDNLDTVRVLLQQTKCLRIKQGRKRLKRQPIDVNIECGRDDNSSPLLRAIQRTVTWRPLTIKLEIIKLLLQQQGIDARKADINGYTPLFVAFNNDNFEIIRLLLERDKRLINYDDRPLLLACTTCRYDFMHYTLHNADITIEANIINLAGSDGNTALHMVISKNRNGGSTPLHAAVMGHKYKDFTTLVNSCDTSELTVQDNDGNALLHLACNYGMMSVVIELCNLIKNPEDFSIRNNQGQTAYDVARTKNFVEIADHIDDMLYNLRHLNEDEEEEICLKDFRFLHRLFNKELDDRFFKNDYKPSRPLQLSDQQRDNESTEQVRLQCMHDALQTFASSRLINGEIHEMLHDSNMQDTTSNQLALQPQTNYIATCSEQLQLMIQYKLEMGELSQQLQEQENTLHETYNTDLFELRRQYRQKQDELMNIYLQGVHHTFPEVFH